MAVQGDEPVTALVVADRRMPTDDVVVLDLRAPDGAVLPPWRPGAHVDLDLGDGTVRQYSLCGEPREPHVWRLAILAEPNGRGGSLRAHALRPGDEVTARGPRNHFPLDDSPNYLFLAGGVGITPILPMIREVASRGAQWRLVYGGRTRASMTFRDELQTIAAERVSFQPQDEVGLMDLGAVLGTPEPDTLVYACGPRAMLDAVEDSAAGWPPGGLRLERFTPRELTDPARTDAFEVELRQSGLTLTVPPERSILDVVAEAGVDVLSSCTEGTCGTCETTVLDGRPDHRDSLLSPEEQESGESMMICVSRSTSDRLVLDL